MAKVTCTVKLTCIANNTVPVTGTFDYLRLRRSLRRVLRLEGFSKTPFRNIHRNEISSTVVTYKKAHSESYSPMLGPAVILDVSVHASKNRINTPEMTRFLESMRESLDWDQRHTSKWAVNHRR